MTRPGERRATLLELLHPADRVLDSLLNSILGGLAANLSPYTSSLYCSRCLRKVPTACPRASRWVSREERPQGLHVEPGLHRLSQLLGTRGIGILFPLQHVVIALRHRDLPRRLETPRLTRLEHPLPPVSRFLSVIIDLHLRIYLPAYLPGYLSIITVRLSVSRAVSLALSLSVIQTGQSRLWGLGRLAVLGLRHLACSGRQVSLFFQIYHLIIVSHALLALENVTCISFFALTPSENSASCRKTCNGSGILRTTCTYKLFHVSAVQIALLVLKSDKISAL